MIKKKLSITLFTIILVMSFIVTGSVNAASKNKVNKPKTIGKSKKTSTKNSIKVKGQNVTILYYCDADNDLEESLMNDIIEMKKGYVNSPNLNLITLVDRTPNESNDSTAFGENFEDTRLYKIEHNKVIRLSGGKKFPEIKINSKYEANMGNPNTLRKFIEFGKANYPADKYVLIMSNHGGGARAILTDNTKALNKAICWDYSNFKNGEADCLYIGEISDYLSEKHSVDVLAFDACLMGTSEVAYQFRPGNGRFSANTLIASSPVVWANGFKYDNVFKRIKSGKYISKENDSTLGGKEQCFDPATITNEQLGALFIEEQKDSTVSKKATDQQLSFYDLSKIENVKISFDLLSANLSKENKMKPIEKLRGHGKNVSLIHYFDEKDPQDWLDYPYYDIYDLCEQINLSKNFSKQTKLLALNVMNDIDKTIVYSFAGSKFNGKSKFKEGLNGLSVFLPDGKKLFVNRYNPIGMPHWQLQNWYNSIDTVAAKLNNPYGKLSWCRDGQDPKINSVGNWFELLDSWFDTTNDTDGGLNHYQW